MVPMWFMDRLVSFTIFFATLCVYIYKNEHVRAGLMRGDTRTIGAWTLLCSMFGFIIFDSIHTFKAYYCQTTWAKFEDEPIDMYALGVWNICIVAFKFSSVFWLMASWEKVEEKYFRDTATTKSTGIFGKTSYQIFRIYAVAAIFVYPVLHLSIMSTPANVSKHLTKLCFTLTGGVCFKLIVQTKKGLLEKMALVTDAEKHQHILNYVRMLNILLLLFFIECTPVLLLMTNGLAGGVLFAKSKFVVAMLLKMFNFGATHMSLVIFGLFFPPHDATTTTANIVLPQSKPPSAPTSA